MVSLTPRWALDSGWFLPLPDKHLFFTLAFPSLQLFAVVQGGGVEGESLRRSQTGGFSKGKRGSKASPERVLISNWLQVWLLPDSPFWVDH